MIPVTPAPEPATFDREVRRPGMNALAAMAGLPQPFPGDQSSKRSQLEVDGELVTRIEDIPSSQIPSYWRRATDDLLTAYDRICAYVAVYIEPVTGARSVDHMAPKSRRPERAYEWENYRLACLRMNGRKRDAQDVLDPFEIGEGWFELELTGFQVRAAPGLADSVTVAVKETVDRLELNDQSCRRLRASYAENYWNRDISLSYLRRRAPFVARELTRQGRLHPEDS